MAKLVLEPVSNALALECRWDSGNLLQVNTWGSMLTRIADMAGLSNGYAGPGHQANYDHASEHQDRTSAHQQPPS